MDFFSVLFRTWWKSGIFYYAYLINLLVIAWIVLRDVNKISQYLTKGSFSYYVTQNSDFLDPPPLLVTNLERKKILWCNMLQNLRQHDSFISNVQHRVIRRLLLGFSEDCPLFLKFVLCPLKGPIYPLFSEIVLYFC